VDEQAKKAVIREMAPLIAEFFTSLIEQRMTRDDAMSIVNNFVLLVLITRGVVPRVDEPPPEPWQG
jgi:hypothetical protein